MFKKIEYLMVNSWERCSWTTLELTGLKHIMVMEEIGEGFKFVGEGSWKDLEIWTLHKSISLWRRRKVNLPWILSGHSLGQSNDHDEKSGLGKTTEYPWTREKYENTLGSCVLKSLNSETCSLFGVDMKDERTFIHSMKFVEILIGDHDVTSHHKDE